MNTHPWHVLHVLSNHEKKVQQHLIVRSVEHYLPMFKERVKWTDRSVVTERPLFSGYVFARIPAQARLTVISTPGILRVLGDEERDLVSAEELDKIRQGLATGLLLRPNPNVSVGTRVKVRTGIFAGAQGIVTELRRQCRVTLALSGVRLGFSLEIGSQDLEILEEHNVNQIQGVLPAFGY